MSPYMVRHGQSNGTMGIDAALVPRDGLFDQLMRELSTNLLHPSRCVRLARMDGSMGGVSRIDATLK